MGGELSTDILIEAYSQGIFPWPQEGFPMLWFCPLRRGILDFSKFHIPKSVRKLIKRGDFNVTFNQAFPKVIENCAKVPRDGETGTWILPDMQQAYCELHNKGIAHSVEAWAGDQLVGGLYGVFIKGLFSGESMFFHRSGASKVCLVQLVEHLQKQGCEWMDIQMVTPVMELFSAEYINRKKFLQRMRETHSKKAGIPFY